MKICIVTPEFPPENWGGLARTAERVAQHAASLGMDVHVARFTILDDPLILLDENRSTEGGGGITLHRIKVSRQKIPESYRGFGDSPQIRAIKMLYQSLEILHEEEGFGLFHSFFLYPAGYVSGLLAKRFGVPSIVTLVGNDVKRHFFQPEAVAMCRSGLDNAASVVALSGELLELADALTPVRQKAEIIYNSVSIPPSQWSPRRTRTSPYRIGSAGMFKYAKGLPYLFKAIAGLSRGHDVTLELVGNIREYERETVERMVETTGIGAILTLKEAVPQGKIQDWLMSLDAFVLPSVSEGCPNILMEAMACGVPSVATRVGAVPDLMEDGVSGLTVPYGNADALRKALERLLAMPGEGASLGENARMRMERFSLTRERQEWQRVYRKVLGADQGVEHEIPRRPLDTIR
jgi:glycosyltransferase involved in cell wall biosynthesis